MTRPMTFRRLFAIELKRVARLPVLWIVAAICASAAVAGTQQGAKIEQQQQQDAHALRAAEDEWYREITARVARYRQLRGAAPIPYWQDPSDVAGFSRYFLKRHAMKPHLPLAALSAGHSDLQPQIIPVKLETLFGGDPVYDYVHPRALAVGVFDLELVWLWLVPVAVVVVTALAGTIERDAGILPLLASQPVSARLWFAARGAAIFTLVVLLLSGGGVAALVAANVETTGLELAAGVLLLAAFPAFWIAVTLVGVALGAGSVAALASGLSIWLVLTLGLPLGAAAVMAAWAPPPSYPAYVDQLRDTRDRVEAERDAIIAGALVQAMPDGAAVDPARLDHSTRLTMLTPEIERRLQHHADARAHRAAMSARVGAALAWISPPAAFQAALQSLAGTDVARHERFMQAVREFQLELRGFVYPRVLREALQPSSRCGDCPVRLSFVDYAAIPRFTMTDPGPPDRVRSAVLAAAWIAGIAALVWAVGLGRARWQ